MLLVASILGIIFVFGVILIIGWLIIWNLMGKFRAEGGNFVQNFCNAANSLVTLFVSIQKFAQDPYQRKFRHELYRSIEDAGEIISEVSSDSYLGAEFTKRFKRKVRIWSDRKISDKKRWKKLQANNKEIGEIFPVSEQITNILNRVDQSLLGGKGGFEKLTVRLVDTFLKAIGVDMVFKK